MNIMTIFIIDNSFQKKVEDKLINRTRKDSNDITKNKIIKNETDNKFDNINQKLSNNLNNKKLEIITNEKINYLEEEIKPPNSNNYYSIHELKDELNENTISCLSPKDEKAMTIPEIFTPEIEKLLTDNIPSTIKKTETDINTIISEVNNINNIISSLNENKDKSNNIGKIINYKLKIEENYLIKMHLIIKEILNHHLKNKKDKIILYNILLKKRYIKKIKTNYFIKMKEERKLLLPKLKKHYNYQVNNIILKEVLYSFYEGKLLNQIFLRLFTSEIVLISVSSFFIVEILSVLVWL